jgi:hypothetical protein
MKTKKLGTLLKMASTVLAVVYMISKQNSGTVPEIHRAYVNPEY